MTYFTTPENPVARTEHQCSVCYRAIEPGERYLRGRGFDGGDAWTFRQCSHCKAVTKLYDPRDAQGLVSEDGFQDWLDNRARDLVELRHKAGFRMRWRAKGGTMLPIPETTGAEPEVSDG